MRRVVLVALCLALAACGNEDTGESGACASAIVLHGALYLGTSLAGPDPPAGRPVDGGIQPGCNDGGPLEPDHEIGLREVTGVPPEVAVYPEWSTSTIYVNTGHFTQLPDHPLHDRLHGSADRPRLRARGRPCLVDGEIESAVFGVEVRTGERTVAAAVDARTRIDGFDRAGLPHLERGDEVRIRGYGCAGDGMLARRITPRP